MTVTDYLFIVFTPDGRVSSVMVEQNAPAEVYTFLEGEPALREYLSVPARSRMADIRNARSFWPTFESLDDLDCDQQVATFKRYGKGFENEFLQWERERSETNRQTRLKVVLQ